ncbi:hypothetical protein AZI86_10805 [Bdellovibrio bacteriovorus]|uniref:Uncharacterized protein n=1 Tax=Bdellovibrio bacteriovorus TaxID=959 RepID=A0A150WLC3_BDEBC|nr:DUF1402 family protein [Bdellovibrio bacteriovorus]KYG64692.1 hypothetical protein AZI86_10805 [Bdellovibrio bacteriovorus]
MKHFILFLFLMAVFSVSGAAEKKITLDELCSYDQFCGQLKENDSSLKKPKASVKKMVEKMAPSIMEYSKMYGVDPRAVGGAILTENTLNVQIDDALQSWLAKNSSLSAKAMSKAGMSVGPGQINLAPAMEAEKHIASLGIRPERTPEEVQALLLTPSGSAEYAAAIIRQAQDAYAKQGIDISKKPEVLATLYNLGKYEERAEKSKKTGTLPKPNYFGYFVQENMDTVEDTIGWSPEKGQFKKLNKSFETSGTFAYLNKDNNLTLKAAPPTCKTAGAGQVGETNMRLTYKEYKTIPAGGLFADVIGATVDCQMQDWVQVRTDRGDIGWMKREQLDDAATERNDLVMPRTCEAPSADCLDKVKKAYNTKDKIEPMRVGTSHEGVQLLPVKKNNDDDPVDWRARGSEDPSQGGYGYCYGSYEDLKKAYQGQINGYTPPEFQELSKSELESILKKTEAKKAEIVKNFKYKDFNDPKNIFRPLFFFSDSLDACKSTQCEVSNYKDLTEILNTDFGKLKGVGALQNLMSKQYGISARPKLSPEARKKADQELADSMKKDMDRSAKEKAAIQEKMIAQLVSRYDDAVAKCKDAARVVPSLNDRFAKTRKDLEKATMVRVSSSSIEGLVQSCNSVRMVAKAKETGEREWQEDQPVNCTIGTGTRSSSLIQTSLDMLVAIDLSPQDYESIVNGPLSEIETGAAAYASTGQGSTIIYSSASSTKAMEDILKGCNYNRLNTVKAVEELANSPCVSTVLVGDPDIMPLLSANAKARIVRDVSLPGDKIGFTTQGSCSSDTPIRKPKERKGKFAE